jgi:hypothetical protein
MRGEQLLQQQGLGKVGGSLPAWHQIQCKEMALDMGKWPGTWSVQGMSV